jgi:hypothetical protein
MLLSSSWKARKFCLLTCLCNWWRTTNDFLLLWVCSVLQKKAVPNIITIHCRHLVAKNLSDHLHKSLQHGIKLKPMLPITNYYGSSVLRVKIFNHTYNIIISVTMQPRKTYLYTLSSHNMFGPSWSSSGVSSYAKTVKLYWISFPHFPCALMFIIWVLLCTNLCCSLIWLIFIKNLLFKILSLKFIFKISFSH